MLSIEIFNLFISKNFDQKVLELISGSGVNLDDFTFQTYPKNKFTKFLFYGRLLEEKGYNLYIEAAKKIHLKHNNTQQHLVCYWYRTYILHYYYRVCVYIGVCCLTY